MSEFISQSLSEQGQKEKDSTSQIKYEENPFRVNLSKFGAKDLADLSVLAKLDTSELYPVVKNYTSDYITFRILLNDILNHLHSCIEIFEMDPIGADENLNQIYSILIELFLLQEIAEGSKMIISAFISSFEALKGDTMNKEQIITMRSIVLTTLNEPFMQTPRAVELCDSLERVGLTIMPENFGLLSDFLNE